MTNRSWLLAVLAVCLIALCSEAGFAIPSLGGPTGIATLPNAAIAPMKVVDTALTYQKARVSNLVASSSMYGGPTTLVRKSEDLRVWSLQALTGVTDEAELWAAYSTVRDATDSHVWGIGGKMLLPRLIRLPGTSLAVGASYQDWVGAVAEVGVTGGGPALLVADQKVTKAYLVATRDLSQPKGETPRSGPRPGTHLLGSAGLLYMRVAPGIGDSDTVIRPFFGLEIKGEDGAELGLEYRWRDDHVDSKAVTSAFLRYRFSSESTIEIGTSNAGPTGTGLDDRKPFIRVGYSIPIAALY